ncbi:MAG: GDP-mannose 4,6-dehydratase [Burkholderiaceae bacterium]
MNAAPRSEPGAATARVLVTGLKGFTGQYVADVLARRGYEVHGTVAGNDSAQAHGAREHVADLLDPSALRAVIETVRPNHVLHMAAIAFVAHGDVDAIYRVNVVGTRNLLKAVVDAGSTDIRSVVLASSANIYGNTLVHPIDETVPPGPANDYAVSKLAMEYMAALWRDQLPITIVRPFNYTGVGQSVQFLLPKIVNAYRQRAAELELGNMDVERDFSDVRDVADAYARLLEAPPGNVVNVCSGAAYSLSEILRLAQDITGHALSVRTNPAFVRANEVRRLQGSNERLCSLIGDWRPRPIRATLAWMLGA